MSPSSLVKTIKVSTIKKRGGASSPEEHIVQKDEEPPQPEVKVAGSPHKTFPRGILRRTTVRRKPMASNDPTSSRKKTMRIMTGTGQKKIRSTLKREVKRMDDKTIRHKLVERRLISSASKANPSLLRKMYEEAVGAGLMKL